MAMSEQALNWIEARGLDVELAVRLGFDSYTAANGGDVIRIPYVVGNDEVNAKHRPVRTRDDGPKCWQDKDGVACFWNFNALCDHTLDSEPLIVTEGEFDALAAIQAGFPRTVSVPNGAPGKPVDDPASTKYAYLEHAKAVLKDAREIILATDSDAPGVALMHDLALRLGKARCKWVRYPQGCKDLNDALVKFGIKGVQETIRRAEWCKVDGVFRMSDLPPYPERKAYSSGFDFLDKHYRVRPGDFTVITGRPGDGKTTFTNDLACRLAKTHGWTIAVASIEQHPQADHRRFIREWHCGAPVREVERVDPDAVKRADEWIDRHFVFIVPGDDDLANLAWTLDKCASAVIRFGAKVIIIDPWNELDHDRPSDMTLTEYTGKAIKEFKRLARELDVHVIVVAHPTKLQAGECPGLYSISDSAHWANKPDVGIVIFKEDRESDQAICKVVKSRYHEEIGRPGTVRMRYWPVSRRFEEDVAIPANREAAA